MRILILLLVLIAIPLSTDAQINASGIDTSTSIISSPTHPEPNQLVTLSLNIFSVDTQGASITWLIDGVEDVAARNQRTLKTTARELGSERSIEVVLALANGAPLRFGHTIKPVRLDVIVEAKTLTPSFYEGRPLPSADSLMRLIALVDDGSGLNPKSYSYLWRQDETVLFGGSIQGGYVAEINQPFGREHTVSVDVINNSGVVIASKTIAIPVFAPEIHFYEDNPLRGSSRNSIDDNLLLLGNEVTVRAVPYYMDQSILSKNYLIEWRVNNQTTDNPNNDEMTITLQNAGGLGVFSIGFHIRNLDQLLQGAEEEFTLRF